jgi:hypothetical protein
MFSLDSYRLPMQPIPVAAKRAIERGIILRDFPAIGDAAALLTARGTDFPDGAYRSMDGRALVLCTTELADVTPPMIDWWFGWHLPESERYQLWHPMAHRKARCEFDRRACTNDRARYIGNVSYVDELIGPALQHLAIAFRDPAEFGFPLLAPEACTAICADTSDRLLHATGGSLIHWVERSTGGSTMRSGFWLGEVRCQMPLIGSLLNPLLNLPPARRLAISNRFLVDLLRHCAEEMNHLARFLPVLHADARNAGLH